MCEVEPFDLFLEHVDLLVIDGLEVGIVLFPQKLFGLELEVDIRGLFIVELLKDVVEGLHEQYLSLGQIQIGS